MGASFDFIRRELGIRRIWYHTFESGNRYKGLFRHEERPPRSLNTTLPRRFCFEEVEARPALVKPFAERPARRRQRHRRDWKRKENRRTKMPDVRFFLLSL